MPLFKQRLFSRLQNAADDGSDSGGGGATITPEVQAIIDAKISEAVTGLKTKNSELLGKLKDASTNLQRFDGIDPAAVRSMMKQFADSEEAGLLAAGKLDEVVSKRTERMQADFTKKLQGSESQIAALNAKAAKLASGKVSGALTSAASKAGALPEAMEDIVLRGQGQGWTINDDGDVVALRDGEIVLGRDGKTPLSPQEWTDTLRETAPHLWPKAQGSGAQGSGSSNNAGKKTITREQFDALSQGERMARAKAGFAITD